MVERVKPIDKKLPVENEFEPDRDDDDEDDAARNRRMTQVMRGVARQASLDPGDGIEL